MEPLIWHNEKRKVNELIPYDRNPRKMTDYQVKKLTESLMKFNLVEVPAIDTDNTIVAGHQRLKIMQLLGRGEEEIDVRVPNRKLTDEEFKEYLLRSNKNTGGWDYDMLANDYSKSYLLDTIGFTVNDLGLSDGKFSDKVEEPEEKGIDKEGEPNLCPHCGKDINEKSNDDF